jgi:hydroxypyruvate isomerase
MPQFAANLSLMYTELPFLERFGAAARDGFAGVEYLFPYAHEPALLAAQLRTHGLRQVLFNAPPGGLRGARMNFVPVWRWRWTTRRRWTARAST